MYNMLCILEVIMKITGIGEEYAIYGLLFSLSNRIQTIGDRDLGDITIKQQFLMIALSMFDHSPTLKEMSDVIGCSYQNVKRMAQQLQKQGYLNIVQDSEDKRKLLLIATDKIEKRADKNREVTYQFMNRLYHDISRKDLQVTFDTLMKMDRNLGGKIE